MGEYVTRVEADRLTPPNPEVPGVGSYVAAALFPIVGVILGIIALAKSRIGPGLALLATSALAFAAWGYVLALI